MLRQFDKAVVRQAAMLIAFYGFLVAGNAVFYRTWSGEFDSPERVLLRLFGVAVISLALWRGDRWARWAGLAFSGVFGVLAGVGLVVGLSAGVFASRPYPAFDQSILVASLASLGTACILLLAASRGAGHIRGAA